jgi:hypothetical protein
MAKSGILMLPGIGARPRSHALRLDHVIVDNETDFAALEPEWEDLFGRARTQTPFLRYS